jgi:hypothetical protein
MRGGTKLGSFPFQRACYRVTKLADPNRSAKRDASMFCNYCRAVNPNDAVYCGTCGRTINPSRETGKAEHEAENPATGISEIPTSVPIAPDQASSSWDYAKMGDEELEQLREAYQRLNVPIPPALQNEIGRRRQVTGSQIASSLRSNSRPVPNSNLGQSPTSAHVSVKSPKPRAKKEGTPSGVILGIFLVMAVALEASFLAVRQTSNANLVESLTKLVLFFALAGWGLLRTISGHWLTLNRVLLIAGVFYVGGLTCLLIAFPKAPAGDRYLKAMLEMNSIGQQIGQIENRQYHSPQDHIDALLQVEPLVRKWRQSLVEAEQASSSLKLSPPPTEAQELQFQQMFSLLGEGIALKEQEVALAHEMQNLPPEEQQQFLDSKLMPLFRHELDLQNRARDLQKKN